MAQTGRKNELVQPVYIPGELYYDFAKTDWCEKLPVYFSLGLL